MTHKLYHNVLSKARCRAALLPMLLIWTVGLGLLLAGLQAPIARETATGTYGDWEVLRGWYSPEVLFGTSIRWSAQRSALRLSSPGRGSGRLTLELVAPDPAAPSQLQLSQDQRKLLTFDVTPELRRYQLFVPLPSGGTATTLHIRATPYHPAGDPRVIGVGLARVDLSGPYRPTLPLRFLLAASASAALLALLAAWLTTNIWVSRAVVLLTLSALALLSRYERTLATAIMSVLPGITLALIVLYLVLRRTIGQPAAQPVFLVGVAAAAGALLRFWNLQWDGGGHFHPDEWVFNEAARTLEAPWHPVFFVYGSLPMYVFRATAALLTDLGDQSWLADTTRFMLISRSASALASSLNIVLLALLARRWEQSSTAGWAAFLLSGVVLAIQNAHFGTTDSLLTLQVTLLAYLSLGYLQQGRRRTILVAGVMLGFALATKVPALSFAIFPLSALFLRSWISRREAPHVWRQCLADTGLFSLATVLSCILGSPYYLLDWRGFMRAMAFEGATAAGLSDYTYQFIGTTPYVYPLRNAALTMGPPLVGLALAGWGWLLVRAARRRQPVELLLLSWPTIYFLFFGSIFIKYNRYTLPLTPFLCLYAAVALSRLARRSRRWRQLSLLTGGLAVATTLGYGVIYVAGVYGQPDPRQAASYWIYQHVPVGSTILREEHEIPALVPFQEPNNPLTPPFGPYLYQIDVLRVYTPATMASPAYYAETLSKADYLLIASRRQHVTFRRLPRHFPVRSCLYRQLFAGNLGYEVVKRFTRAPHLGSWRVDGAHDPLVEQTFQVFDHPTVMIFARTKNIQPAEIKRVFSETCQLQ